MATRHDVGKDLKKPRRITTKLALFILLGTELWHILLYLGNDHQLEPLSSGLARVYTLLVLHSGHRD
jgi:hypothetical protein